MPTPSGSSGYVGGGSATDFCSVTPADQAASIDNILSRLTALETIISQLLGVDVTAIQLTDFGTQDLGTMLGGSLGGSILQNTVLQYLRANTYGNVGGDTALVGAGEYTEAGMGNIYSMNPIGVNAFSGLVSTASYTFWPGYYDAGFYFQGRAGFFPTLSPSGLRTTALPKIRFFIGLGSSLFRNFAANNSDNPPCTYICFNFSQPRGDSTWKLILNGQSGALASPDPATVIDTGMPINTYHWYDFHIRNEPGGAISWQIDDVTLKTSLSGSSGTPFFYENEFPGFSDPLPAPAPEMLYNAGCAEYNTTAVSQGVVGIHHIFCQTLDIDRHQTI